MPRPAPPGAALKKFSLALTWLNKLGFRWRGPLDHLGFLQRWKGKGDDELIDNFKVTYFGV